ncbi:uncharacterized protein G2W53_026525 [Senna tora]|uniref:Uncharacterized protein n=1 Tax=Senna tora TaxID=362788 RepID=A0A834TFV1_9FABA|nr:uncharacterized protein G2W53_026525 [Senna tora]
MFGTRTRTRRRAVRGRNSGNQPLGVNATHLQQPNPVATDSIDQESSRRKKTRRILMDRSHPPIFAGNG